MDFPPQQQFRKRARQAALVNWLVADELQLQNFNTYQPAIIALFVVAFILVSAGSIYAAAAMKEGTDRSVLAGTGFSGWLLLIVTAVLYGVSVAPPQPQND